MFSHLSLFNLFAIVIGINLQHFHQIREDQTYWENLAKKELFDSQHKQKNLQKAKNVIIFVGGGMGLSTITSARILKGQLNNSSGEEAQLVFEAFPDTCLLKTYSVDNQVPDSEGSATALLSGVKTNNGVIGVSAKVKKGEKNCQTVRDNKLTSIFDLAFKKGKSTGIVTNTKLTGGVAAGSYANIANSDWETGIPSQLEHHKECQDIGRQLVENSPGKDFNVILGTGGLNLLPKNYTDPTIGKPGLREDGLNLIDKWLEHRKSSGLSPNSYQFVNNRESLMKAIESHDTNYLLGVFSELKFEKERDLSIDPSLADMTEAAIKMLYKNVQGFLLVVENGLIDMAHHENIANMALYETLALEKAIESALKLVSIDETLIIVTADHGQALTMNGYQPRGHNIMGVADNEHETNKGFTTLIYSTGPGYNANRVDANSIDTSALRYRAHSGIYLGSSYHTGEDVALYSVGPMSHLFHGTKEMTFVAHAMQFASCFGRYQHYEHCIDKSTASKS